MGCVNFWLVTDVLGPVTVYLAAASAVASPLWSVLAVFVAYVVPVDATAKTTVVSKN